MEQSPLEAPDHLPKKENPAFYLSIGAMSMIWLITLAAGSFLCLLTGERILVGENVWDTIAFVLLFAGIKGILSLLLWTAFIMLLEGLNDKGKPFPSYILWLNVRFVAACTVYGILLAGLLHAVPVVLRYYIPDVLIGLALINSHVFRRKKKAERTAI
jgi:hypothetical protein